MMDLSPVVTSITIQRFGDDALSVVQYQLYNKDGIAISGPGLMPSQWMDSFKPADARRLIECAEADLNFVLGGKERTDDDQEEGLKSVPLNAVGIGEQSPR